MEFIDRYIGYLIGTAVGDRLLGSLNHAPRISAQDRIAAELAAGATP